MGGSTMSSFKGSKPSEREGRYNPKTIGEIPGYPVGSRFLNRDDLSGAGVHAPLRAGIHGNKVDGAYSVVLSYGYEDDADYGDTFVYTGQGGRSSDTSKFDQMLSKESWSSHQSSDQEWKLGNKALQISWVRGSPVRVIRGAPRKGSDLSKYAPSEGLRYDGLYQVTHAWKDEGATGFQTCKFRFDRLPNQLPLPGGHAPCLNDASLLKLPRVGQSSSNSSKFPRDDSSKPVNKPARVPFVPRPPYRPSEADIAKLKSKKKSKSTSTSYSITPEYARGATSRAAPPSNLTHLPPAPEVQMESETEMDAVKSEREDNVNLEARSPSASPDCADFVRRVWTPQPEDDSDSDSDSDSESESESEEEEEEEGESDSRTSDEDETPILGSIPVYSDSPIIERENRKRPYDAVSEESGSDRGDVAVESDEDALCEANDRARPWATVRGKQKLPPLSFKKKWKPE